MKRKIGRPTTYNKDMGDMICKEISLGKSLRTIYKEKGVCVANVFRWLDIHQDFKEQYEKAKQEQADAFIEDMLEIADEEHKVLADGKLDSAAVNKARLRIDTRKWIASKLKPKRYGESSVLKHEGQVSLSISDAAKLYDAEAKSRSDQTD